ncbi:MAG: hypothetical protein AAFP02_24005, partial [Bacteroidota bacterium]
VQEQNDGGGDWIFDQGGTPTGGTGPSADHTTGTAAGYYAYVEDNGAESDSVILTTPCFDVSGLMSPKFSFWYHSNNSQGPNGLNENELHIDLIFNGNITYDFIPPIVHKDNNWNLIELNMSSFIGVFAFRFRVNSNNGSFVHDIAIDDINVVEVLPQDVGVTALLDPLNGCGLVANDSIILEIENLGTDSVYSGFDVSYTLNGGAVTTVTINDTILSGNTLPVAFSPVDLSVPGTYTLVAWTSGLAGDTNFANDTLITTIISETSGVLPVVDDFETYPLAETVFAELLNDPNNDMNWEVESGPTGSFGTGPDGAYSGNNYIYIESSFPPNGARAVLRSGCLDLSGTTNPVLI